MNATPLDELATRAEVKARTDALVDGGGPDIPRLDWRTVITAAPDTPPDVVEALDKYFAHFAQPRFNEKRAAPHPMVCLSCGEDLTGLLASIFGAGGFQWGIAHGEGFCARCRWPGRAIHYIKDAAGEPLVTLRHVVLQYHPSELSRSEAR